MKKTHEHVKQQEREIQLQKQENEELRVCFTFVNALPTAQFRESFSTLIQTLNSSIKKNQLRFAMSKIKSPNYDEDLFRRTEMSRRI